MPSTEAEPTAFWQVGFFSTRPIRAAEELSYNYGAACLPIAPRGILLAHRVVAAPVGVGWCWCGRRARRLTKVGASPGVAHCRPRLRVVHEERALQPALPLPPRRPPLRQLDVLGVMSPSVGGSSRVGGHMQLYIHTYIHAYIHTRFNNSAATAAGLGIC
jgi:hypothetical protein